MLRKYCSASNALLTHRVKQFLKPLPAFEVHIAMKVKVGTGKSHRAYLMADKPPDPMPCDQPGILAGFSTSQRHGKQNRHADHFGVTLFS